MPLTGQTKRLWGTPKRGMRSVLLGRRLLQQVMDAAQRKQIGMLYLIDGRRLTRSTSSSATVVARAPNREQRSDRPSDREIAVLQLVADGFANREIGLSLQVSEETVKSHIRNLLAKLEASNRAHAVSIAIRRGFIV
jgi:DNA-binding NarL/FixJ family response regulator